MELIFVAAILYVLWLSFGYGKTFNPEPPKPEDPKKQNEKDFAESITKAAKAFKKLE